MLTTIYGEAEVGVTGKITNEPDVMKGGQTLLVGDVHHIVLHAYRHRHKLHVNTPGWTLLINIEVK